jgi:hypothetical protein
VLEEVILRGARSAVFAVSPDSAEDVALAAIAAWSAAHGLTMFAIDRIPRADLSVDDMIDRMLRMVVTGLQQGASNRHVGPLALRSDIAGRTSSRSSPAASRHKKRATK